MTAPVQTVADLQLNSLSLLHLHRDIPIDRAAFIVIDEFARRHPRRLQLLNVLADEDKDESDWW